MLGSLLLAAACGSSTDESGSPAPEPVPWSKSLPPIADELDTVRGFVPRRAIIHLHTPWSHDACDGEPLVDGEPDPVCLADLRDGLCQNAVDLAYVTDHPATAAEREWGELFLAQPGDELFDAAGAPTDVASEAASMRFSCPDRDHRVVWMPGIEDELMPLGLERHAGTDAADNDRLYNEATAESVAAEAAAGAIVMVAHTEGRTVAELSALVPEGLRGVELFNLHAMFDPSIREEDLGLDPLGWAADIAPFTAEDSTAVSDLLYLAVHQEQAPSVATWDALQDVAPTVGVAGTDAHRNSMPLTLPDAERGDSYRRMMRWFNNVLLTTGDGAAAADEALDAGRLFAAFEVLGTPAGLDVFVEDDEGVAWEMGSSAPPGTLRVVCPGLSPLSPRNLDEPQITATVYRDGLPWQEGCGDFPVDGPASYRVRFDIVPWHLADFLGDAPDPWMKSYPWVYTNPIRVAASR